MPNEIIIIPRKRNDERDIYRVTSRWARERPEEAEERHPRRIQFSTMHMHTHTRKRAYVRTRTHARTRDEHGVTHALRVRYASRLRLCAQVEGGAG